jgi:putative transposase
MPRVPRVDITDTIYHVINRRVGKMKLFLKDSDYKSFELLLEDIVNVQGMRLIAYCLMPNHWHLILQPRYDGHMAKTLHWLTTTHACRWHQNTNTVGQGPLYQGRYKSFPIEENAYLLNVIRYVESNPLRAGLVSKAEEWRFSSLPKRIGGKNSLLSDTIVPLPSNYLRWVNDTSDEDIETLRNSVNKGVPFGSDMWMFEAIEKFGLQSTVNKTGRPRKY